MNSRSIALALVLTLSGCFGGAKPPPTLMTLTSAQVRAAQAARTSAPGQAVTVVVPNVPRELQTLRVPVQESDTAVSYLKDAQWVDMPASLFGRLLSETIEATTTRVVLDPKQFSMDPGTRLTGTLQRFGLDARRMEAVAVYDAVLATGQGGVTTQRFEVRVPVASADGAVVAPALNQAANQIASDVARWIGG